MYLTILFLFGLCLTAVGQESGSRSCRIVFLMPPPGAPRTLQLFDGTTSQEVELPRMNFSKVYQIASGAVTLRLLPEAPAKAEEVNPSAPKASVPTDVSDCYLLVASDPSNPVAPVRISVVDASQSVFKNGQMLWFNLSDKTVGGQLGSRNLALAPNARTIVDSPAGGREDYNVNLAYQVTGDTTLQPICETKWRHDPNSRSVLFVINEPNTRTPRVMGFPDRRERKVEP